MGILIELNRETQVLVQGITGREGSFHTKAMLEYGTKIVAGVTPGKGGREVWGVPVYDSVEEALAEHPNITASVVFVPARYAVDAVIEAIRGGIRLVVVITEHIPVHDTIKIVRYAMLHGATIVGPNTPGIIVPGETKLGIMPGRMFTKGRVAVVSRSGTLTYEIAGLLSRAGLGQSIAVGIGGDPVVGLSFVDVLRELEDDERTDAVVVIGEIGGDLEERLAQYIGLKGYSKPVVAYVAGRTAPPGKRMGHAGAIISAGTGDAASKIRALQEVGVPVAKLPSDVPRLLKHLLS